MKIHRILPEPEYFRKLIRDKKVAAYCRVSSSNEEQLSSYKNQIEYYESYIKAHTNWELVKVYADICSGRNNIKMLQFQEMMAECRKGNIDLIFVLGVWRRLNRKNGAAGGRFWGVADDATWLDKFPVRGRKNWPLLFDEAHQQKPAYEALLSLRLAGRSVLQFSHDRCCGLCAREHRQCGECSEPDWHRVCDRA
ncbi:MAG: recombinase family protein [Bacillota bacterium]|nr:recombinase family protein [Bacillota bacterium]